MIFTRHFLHRVYKCTKHMGIDACPKVNIIENRLQGSSEWKTDESLETTFHWVQSQHFAFKSSPPALVLLFNIPSSCCRRRKFLHQWITFQSTDTCQLFSIVFLFQFTKRNFLVPNMSTKSSFSFVSICDCYQIKFFC
jgi:hypothetical protein